MRVASTTKSFTSALIGQLVDEGVLEWTRPVREYHPDFMMMDPFASAEMTLEDMLSHRSGLLYHENLLATGVGRELAGSPRGWRENLVRRLRHFEPSHPFRSHFQYQDIVVTAAGAIVERVMDTDYETLIERRLLGPLGLERSTFSRAAAKATGLLAESYAEVDGDIVPMDFIDVRYLAPTAGLYSNAAELLRWVQFHLDDGRAGDRRLVSKAQLDRVHAPHRVIDSPGSIARYRSADITCAQGWYRAPHRGHTMITHGGSFNGHRTTMAFVPELGIGVVVLCNLNLTEFTELTNRVVLDRLLGVDGAGEWDACFTELKRQRFERDRAQVQAFEAGRNPANGPRQALAAYAGTYSHPGYGTFVVAWDGARLSQTCEGRTFPLDPYDGEMLATRFHSAENSLLRLTMTFVPDAEGKVVAVSVPLIPGIAPQRFVRK